MVKDITVDSSLRALLGNGGSIAEKRGKAGETDFEDMLKQSVLEVNNLQKEAEAATSELLKGGGSVHDTMIAIEKADLSFRFMMQVRNKIVDAYQEVMRMPV